MASKQLTDRKLQSLKAATTAKRHYDVWDRDGLGVRVSYEGRKTFVLMARYPGSNNPTRRALGSYPAMSLADARAKADRWRKLIAAGKDPREEEERKRENSFRAVAEQFITHIHRQKLRTAP